MLLVLLAFKGLVSKAGWAVVDDTTTARWAAAPTTATEAAPPPAQQSNGGGDGDGGGGGDGGGKTFARWFDQSAAPIDVVDLYGFFPGRKYATALQDFAAVAGPTDFPPLSAFGIWWSRYWVYSTGVPEVPSVLHAGRSTRVAPRGPLHGGLQIFFILTCAQY